MTKREEEILELISKNPTISQKEIADMLGITRSSVGVHIANLMKKGYIQGKGYIVKTKPYVLVIGGANVDITGFPYNNLIPRDSNPGKIKMSLGGVGRNIAENLARLGIHARLITAMGRDLYGEMILEQGRKLGLDMSDSLILDGEATSNYLCVLDEKGDMEVAISSMDIFEKLDISFIQSKKDLINNSTLCILDTNISENVLQYIVKNFKETDFFLDTVSTTKAKKVKDIIGYFHTIKPNRLEAEILSEIKINNNNDLEKAAHYFLNKGVKRVFISLGEKGVYFNDGRTSGQVSPGKTKVLNATGAGDAFLAALAYSHINDFGLEKSAKFATAASLLTLESSETINPNISAEMINIRMEEF